MIEIKCTKAERLRLTKVLMGGECLWPWMQDTCYARGYDCRECIVRRIRWIMTDRDEKRHRGVKP